jgi:pimeloyl-ACP methyl ester carboxylesterase
VNRRSEVWSLMLLTVAPSRLYFDPDIEAMIYRTIPHGLWSVAAQLSVPVAFIGGLQSAELAWMGGVGYMRDKLQFTVRLVKGSHLFPLEQPVATAEAIEDVVGEMMAKRDELDKIRTTASSPRTPTPHG